MRIFLYVLALWVSTARAQECTVSQLSHASTVVTYSHVSGVEQATVLTPTRDGAAQAVDATTGSTLWTFDAGDEITDLRVLRFDADDDGAIDVAKGDRVWLYFGARDAATASYYALDISDRLTPKVLWTISATDAQSTPTIARVRVSGATQNGEHFVIVFGNGKQLRMVDAATGAGLWSTETDREMPARVAMLDTDGDKLADRMYAVDIVGQLFRFDIANGKGGDERVTKHLVADLSGEDREFLNAPDVSLIQPRGRDPYYNVALGAGGMFFSVRDKQLDEPVTANDLVDIAASLDGTPLTPDVKGWKLNTGVLGDEGGEVLGESITADGVVLFTTLQRSTEEEGACEVGSSRVYAVRIDSGTPGLDLNDDGNVTAADVSTKLPAGAAPGPVQIRLGRRSGGDTPPQFPGPRPGPPPYDPSDTGRTKCFVGSHALSKCVNAGAVLRTFWLRPAIR